MRQQLAGAKLFAPAPADAAVLQIEGAADDSATPQTEGAAADLGTGAGFGTAAAAVLWHADSAVVHGHAGHWRKAVLQVAACCVLVAGTGCCALARVSEAAAVH